MLKHQKHQSIVYNANGVEFTIYKTTKPTKSGHKYYWVLVDYSTGKRRLLNNRTQKAARLRADKIRAAMVKGQAHQSLLSHGQLHEVCAALGALRSANTFESVGSVVRLWLECTMMLGDRATPLDAVKYYIANHRENGPQPEPTSFDEAAKLYHAFKVADGKSASHCGNIESQLKRLAGTGFDVPSCSTIYLDKPLRNHTLMQTIARANRVFGEKVNGLIVDYVGVFRDLQKALAIYAGGGAGGGGGPTPVEKKTELIAMLKKAIAEAVAFCKERGVDVDQNPPEQGAGARKSPSGRTGGYSGER